MAARRTLKAARAELVAVQDRLDALYWAFTRTRRGRPPAVVAPELYVRRRELEAEIRDLELARAKTPPRPGSKAAWRAQRGRS